MFYHYLFDPAKFLVKVCIIDGRATEIVQCERKSSIFEIGAKPLGAGYMRTGVCSLY